jgi:hypothetical protein
MCITTQPSRSPDPTNVIRGLYGSGGDGDGCDGDDYVIEYRSNCERVTIIVFESNNFTIWRKSVWDRWSSSPSAAQADIGLLMLGVAISLGWNTHFSV